MIHDPKDKARSGKTREITEGNNPNDDEEILDNDEVLENSGSNTDDSTKENDNKQGSETIGIP